ncbi:hypothetical protein BKA80DRAFT_137731 [Phyllosticta citrichinensis]
MRIPGRSIAQITHHPRRAPDNMNAKRTTRYDGWMVSAGNDELHGVPAARAREGEGEVLNRGEAEAEGEGARARANAQSVYPSIQYCIGRRQATHVRMCLPRQASYPFHSFREHWTKQGRRRRKEPSLLCERHALRWMDACAGAGGSGSGRGSFSLRSPKQAGSDRRQYVKWVHGPR